MKIYDLTTASNLDRAMLIPVSLLRQDMKISLGQLMKMVEDGIVLPPSLKAQYSADGTVWHAGLKSSDEWMRLSDDGGATWSDPMPLRGKDGQEGLRNYTWIKFADDEHGSGMSDSPAGKSWLGIAYNKDTAEESDDPADYTWMSVKGDPGRSVTSVVSHYATGNNPMLPPPLAVFVDVPPGKVPVMTATDPVLWRYDTTYFSDGTEEDTVPAVAGVHGDKGESPTIKWDGTKLKINDFDAVDLRGLSAYEVHRSVDPSSTLTESEWVASLKGEPGADGTSVTAEWNGKKLVIKHNGIAINDGVDLQGAPGKDGDTLSIDPITKRWVIGGKPTDIIAQGVNGQTWKPQVAADGTLSWIKSDDANLPTAVNIKGDKGEKGEQGVKGDKGEQGVKGDTGDRGERGLQGIQGLSAYEVYRKVNVSSTITESEWVASLKGDKGERGLKGDKGDKGDQGIQGIQGLQGVKGDKGDKGDQGIQGIQGIQGVKGDRGIQGLSAYEVYKKNNTSSLLSESDWLFSLKGDIGPTGPRGEKGTDGKDGTSVTAEWSGTRLIIKNNGTAINSGIDLKGAPGSPGADGKTWKPQVAADGTLSWTQSSDNTAPTAMNIKGAPGLTYRPVYDPVTKKMTFSASSDTSAVVLDNIASVEMVEKLQLASDKDGNFKVVVNGSVTGSDRLIKVTDFTTIKEVDDKVVSTIAPVNTNMNSHINDTSIHVNAFEKARWNQAVDSLAGYVTLNTAQTITGVKTFVGEQKFVATGNSYTDPWSGTVCAIKVTGKVGVTDSIKAASFVKQGGTSAQFLKADGSVDSHDYATNSDVADLLTCYVSESVLDDYYTKDDAEHMFVTALAVSGNQIAPVIYGMTGKAITVPYATTSNRSNYLLTATGNIDPNTMESGAALAFVGGIDGASSNIPTQNGWMNALVNIGLHSNNAAAQLYFSHDRSMFFRPNKTAAWRAILDSENYSSILDSRYYTEAEADARYVTALRVTGDALTYVKNGVGTNVTPPYATESKVLRSHGRLTAESGTTQHGAGVRMYEVYNNGYPVAYGNVLAVQGASAVGGGELLFGWSGTDGAHASLYYRNRRDVASASWSAWATILDSENYGSVLGNVYASTSRVGALESTVSGHTSQINGLTGSVAAKVSKAGDTMTGTLNVPRVDVGNMYWDSTGIMPTIAGNNLYTCGKVDGRWANVYATTINVTSTALVSNLNADLLDGLQGTSYAYGGRISFLVGSARANITTAQFISKLSALGAFNRPQWSVKCTWSYANNDIITDTGLGNIQLAGAVIEVFSNSANEYTIRVTTSPTTTDNCVANAVFIYRNHGSSYAPNWKRLANTSDNVASATKLQTARTLWGRSFDGTGNVDGAMTINYTGETGILLKRLDAGSGAFIRFYNNNQSTNYFRIGMLGAGYFGICYNSGTDALAVTSDLNIGIGTNAPAYKLDVRGSIIADSWVRTRGNTGWYNETHGGGWCMSDSTWIRNHNNKNLYMTTAIIRTDGEMQVGAGGEKFRVTAAGAVSSASSVTAASFVKRGGNASQLLAANGSVRGVLTYDDLSDNAIDVRNISTTEADPVVTREALSSWDGSYKINSLVNGAATETRKSDLAYCNKGAFGDMATKSAADYVTVATAQNISGIKTHSAVINVANVNGMWVLGKTNAAIRFNNLTAISTNAAHYFFNMKAASGHVLAFGGLNNTIGFYTFLSSRTDNGTDSALTCDTTTGKWTTNKAFTATSFIKSGGTASQVLMADGSVRETLTSPIGTMSGLAIPASSPQNSIVEQWWLMNWDGRFMLTGDDTAYCNLRYCDRGRFGDIVTHNASEFLASGSLSGYATQSWVNSQGFLKSHQSLANYVTRDTAQTITGNKTFTGLVTAMNIQPQGSGLYNLGTMGLHWNHVFCRRLYVTSGGSDSLTAANLGAAVGLGWLELRSAGTPYIDLTGNNSTADYNVRLAYQNSQLEVLGSHLSVANTLRCKAYVAMIFDAIGSDTKANTYGVMVYKRGTYFNFVKTVKGAPDTISSSHGGSLMEFNLATNATSFAGVVTASNISTSSDARLKTRVDDIALTVADIAAAPLWRYKRKDTGAVDVGSTAQYWGAILPELTHTDQQGWMSLDYGKTALLASVSLARTAADHETRIKALEAENALLRDEIARLRAA